MQIINAEKLWRYLPENTPQEVKDAVLEASVDVVWKMEKIAGETFYIPCVPEREIRRGADD